jgi:hypothetical protein
MRRTAWSSALDLKRAATNLRIEMGPSDWHLDPWGWPELDYLVTKEPDLVLENCMGSGALEHAPIDVPKENWGTRPAVLLDITDRLMYQALVDRMSLELIGDLSRFAYGWRLPAKNPKRAAYARNGHQWDSYRGHLSFLVNWYSVGLRTDLVSFFASLPIDSVQGAVQDCTPKGDIADRLCSFLGGFDEKPGRSGLPQRSFASAAIANMYLKPLDDVLTHHSDAVNIRIGPHRLESLSWARWMDDMWLFGDDPAAARRAQMDLQSVAQDNGMNLNYSKTEVLDGADLDKAALQIEHSAVDDAIASSADFTPLEELVDRLLDERERASRTTVRFVAKRMRDHKHPYRSDDIMELAARMPHVADTWARLMQENFKRGELQDWFLDYTAGGWATHDWAISQFARMLPSSRPPRQAVREYFADAVRDSNTTIAMLSVAAQRLCAWDRAEGRDACRDAMKRAGTPHARRALALSALGVGERRATVRKWLDSDKENYATLRMLDDRSFVSPKVSPYFAEKI